MDIIDINTVFGAYPSEHADSTADTLTKEMAAHDVSRSVTLSTWGIFHRDTMGNDHTLRAQQHFAGKLFAAATISPHGFFSDATVDMLLQQPFVLYRFFPMHQDWPIDYAPFQQILRVLAEVGKPVMVTVTKPGEATALGRLAADFPGPVILEGVSSRNMAEALCVMQTHDHFCVETHAFKLPGALETYRDRIGIERILFGSGSPALSVGSALSYIVSSALSGEDKAAVLGANATRLVLGEA